MSQRQSEGGERLVRQTARIIFVEALGAIIVLLIVATGALAIRLSQGPMSIGFAKAKIEEAIAQARDGREVSIGEIALHWLTTERRVIVLAEDLLVYDDEGQQAARADNVQILVDLPVLLAGRVKLLGLVLDGGTINIENNQSSLRIAGDPIETGRPASSEAQTEEVDWFATAERVLDDVLTTLRNDANETALQTIRFSNFELLVSTDGEEAMRLSGAFGDLQRGTDGIVISVGAVNLDTEDAPGRFTLGLTVPDDYSVINADLGFLDWSLQSVLDLVPSYRGAVSGFASDASLQLQVSGERGLEALEFGVQAEAGRVLAGDLGLDVSALTLAGEYGLETDELTLNISDLKSTWVDGAMRVSVSDVLQGDGRRGFDLSSDGLNIDLTQYFEAVWRLDDFVATGQISVAERVLGLSRLAFSNTSEDGMTAKIVARGEVAAVADRQAGELPARAEINAELEGQLAVSSLMTFWPERQARGARGYVARNVTGGIVTAATLELDIDRASAPDGHLADDALTVTFLGSQVSVKPLRDIPLIENASLDGRITGNSVKIDFTGGDLSAWRLRGGSVHYPQLVPAGADMIVTVEGNGPAQDLVRMISDSRLQLEARSGFKPERISGEADLKFELRRPALPDTPLSAIRYSGTGQLLDGGLDKVFADLSLRESAAGIEFDQAGLRVFGDGKLQDGFVSYDWRFPLGNNAPPASLSASTVMTPDFLNDLGVAARAYMVGIAPMDIEATLQGAQLRTADIALDLQEARLDVAELGWVKEAGEAATAKLTYQHEEGRDFVSKVRFRSAGASLDGEVMLAEDGKLLSADIGNVTVAGRFDVGGKAMRTDAGGLRFEVEGDLLNLSALVPNFAAVGSSETSRADLGNIELDAKIAELVLGRDFNLSDAVFRLTAAEEGLETVTIGGSLESGLPFNAAYDASGLGDPAFIVSSMDAGFLPKVLFGTDALQGGELELTGTVGQGGLPTRVNVVITEGRLVQAPVITQVLSIASLRGLSDTLSGDGILFSRIEVPLSVKDGRYDIIGARASGPALGLTARGWINPSDGGIDVDGVMVPSFGINSALGGLPLIGDLFVSREGEGVFSLRYGVEGTLERAQVSVNPFSAITPGVLRRIFENPETAELPPLEIPPDQPEPKPDE